MHIFFLFSFIVGFSSWAADKITWEESLNEVVNSNSELSSAKSSLQSSSYQMSAASSGFFPQVSATANYNYDSTTSPKSFSTSISAVENIFSGFSDITKVERAKYINESTFSNLESVKAKLSYDLKSAFMGLVYSQKNIILTDDIIKRREANLKLVQLRFESGRENIGAFNLSKAYLAQAKYEHLEAMNALDLYQSQLAKVLGRAEWDTLEVVGDVPISTPGYLSNRDLNYKELILSTPEYKKAFLDQQIAKTTLDLSKSSFYPTLNLNQSVARVDHENYSIAHTWSIGATLIFPFFSGGKDYYNFKSANEDYRASTLNLKTTKALSVGKLKDAYSKFVEAVMKLEVDQAFVLAASSRERIAKAQYNNGLISFSDWDLVENDLINRQKGILISLRERVIAEALWEQVQGKGVIP